MRAGLAREHAITRLECRLHAITRLECRCVRDWLVSQSAKDCSILITVLLLPPAAPPAAGHAPAPPGGFRRVSVRGAGGAEREVLCRCGVVDLDIKRADKIPYYLGQDAAVVEAYLADTTVSQSTWCS